MLSKDDIHEEVGFSHFEKVTINLSVSEFSLAMGRSFTKVNGDKGSLLLYTSSDQKCFTY